jgi:lipid A 3-O-deacylase
MKVQQTMFFMAGAVFAGMAGDRLPASEPPSSSTFQCTELTAQAALPSSNGLTLDSHASGIWQDGVGLGFRKGVSEAGLSVGPGVGSSILGSTEAHDLLLAKVHYGKVFSEVMAGGKWYSGNWEWLAEAFGGAQWNPDQAYVIGLTPVLRYNFATGTRWMPFFDAGAGGTLTDIGRPDLGGNFQFNLQTGPGVHWFVDKGTVLTMQYRFLHISNASIQDPDHGVNTSVFYVGIARFF